MEKENKKHLKTNDLTKIALLVALLSVSSYINIPLPFTPIVITAQTVVINLIGLILEPAQTMIATGTWILLGTIGIPVFSGGSGGLGKLFGPTGGYILGCFFAAMVISKWKGKRKQMFRYCVVTIILGMPIIYLIGTIYMKILTGLNWKVALGYGVLPFIPGDIAKCIIASIVAAALNKALPKTENGTIILEKNARN